MGIPKIPPKLSPRKKKPTTLQYLFKIDTGANGISVSLPSSPGSPCDEILSAISSCTQVFTFTDPSESPAQQDLKRHNLIHILSVLRTMSSPLDDRILSPLISMLATNLFRPLPPQAYPCLPSDSLDDDPPAMVLAPSWPHLQIIYDMLAALIKKSDIKFLPSHIDRSFLLNLLTLFQSEDPRERDRLKLVYHQLYSKMTTERSFMRRSMSNAFLHFAFETERHCGIGELLEVWGSIINGFTVPLKEEHRVFLVRVLVPLHKPKGMQVYHQQLSYCVTQFVQKEPQLGRAVVKGILKYWPVANCQKELLLIGELEDLVENLEVEKFEKAVAVVLCSQIARCLISYNSQVAERALCVWNNEQFVRMASQSMEQVLPPMVRALENNIRWHWNKSVQQQAASVKTMLEEMEPQLYSKCLVDLDLRESMVEQEAKERKEKWERLELAAAQSHSLQPAATCICVSNLDETNGCGS